MIERQYSDISIVLLQDWKMDWFVCIDKWENMTFKDVYFLQKSLGEDVFFSKEFLNLWTKEWIECNFLDDELNCVAVFSKTAKSVQLIWDPVLYKVGL